MDLDITTSASYTPLVSTDKVRIANEVMIVVCDETVFVVKSCGTRKPANTDSGMPPEKLLYPGRRFSKMLAQEIFQ